MNSWIKIFLSFFVTSSVFACSFKDSRRIYSLSGPITVLAKELGLLNHLKGISTFHPVSKSEFKGEMLPGGIFLSRSKLDEMKGAIIFYDQSQELTKTFKNVSGVEVIEVKTRGLTPEEVLGLTIKLLSPYLKDCEAKITEVKIKSEKLTIVLLKLIPRKLEAVFYIGEIRGSRVPEIAMVEDGIVKWLKRQELLVTYPSELAYVNWSAKVLSQLSHQTWHVGVKDTGGNLVMKVEKKASRQVNLYYPGALVPGITQQEAWIYLLQNLNR